jgi:Family of unknown function (DUF6510)
MPNDLVETSRDFVLDANSVAGLLTEIFNVEMTAEMVECAHCGNEAEIGTLLAFTRGPGVILRCSTCGQVVLRIVQTPAAIHLDARGAVYLKLPR